MSQPTEIARQGKAIKTAGPKTETQELQYQFWTIFREKLLEKKVVTSAQAPRPQYWFDIALGRSYIHLSCIANAWDGRIGVRVYISNKIVDLALPKLEAKRTEIEAEIGEQLQWNPYPEKMDKIIVLDRTADLEDRNKWPEYISWLVERVDKFKRAFGPRVKQLDFTPGEAT